MAKITFVMTTFLPIPISPEPTTQWGRMSDAERKALSKKHTLEAQKRRLRKIFGLSTDKKSGCSICPDTGALRHG